MDDVSNARPLAIFSGYMILAASLTAACIAIIRSGPVGGTKSPLKSPRRPYAVVVFSLLAAFSLATTWFHMLRFFSWSYDQWALAHPAMNPDTLYLGNWLRDTTLFKQAWASTLETAPRAWWSLQIFGFCGIWSVMLACQARIRGIPHLWLFMLLGQVVAISFASNLFFLAVLLYDARHGTAARPRFSWPDSPVLPSTGLRYDALLGINVGLSTMIPATFDKRSFMFYLIMPHLLAFAPLVLDKIKPNGAASNGVGGPHFVTKVVTMVVLLAVGTSTVYEDGGNLEVALQTLYEHPAVSSVGWDVICCWMSYVAWELLGVE